MNSEISGTADITCDRNCSSTGDQSSRAVALARARIITALAFLVSVAVVSAAVYLWLPDYKLEANTQSSQCGAVVADRHNRILRIFPDSKERFSIWHGFDEFPECLKLAVIAGEDKRFYSHPGFDPLAIMPSYLYEYQIWTNHIRSQHHNSASRQIAEAQAQNISLQTHRAFGKH